MSNDIKRHRESGWLFGGRVIALLLAIAVSIHYNLTAGQPLETGLRWIEWCTYRLKLRLSETLEGAGIVVFDSVLRVTAANIGLVLVYGFVILCLTYRLPSEIQRKWFDTLYFMGFILTLVALIITLGNTNSIDTFGIEVVVVHSAIALSSTAIALILRTIFIAAISNVYENEDPESFETLESEIRGLANSFSEVAKTASDFNARLARLEQKTGEATDMYTQRLRDAADALKARADDINAIELDQEMISKQMVAAVETVLGQTGETLGVFSKTIESAGSDFAKTIDKAADKVDVAANTMSDGLSTITRRIEDAYQELETAIRSGAEPIEGAIAAFVQSIETAAETSTQIDLDGIVRDGLSTNFEQVTTFLTEQQTKLATATEAYSKAIDAASVTQSKGTDEMQAHLDELEARREQMAALNDAVSEILSKLDQSILSPSWHEQQIETLTTVSDSLDRVATVMERISPARGRFWRWLKGVLTRRKSASET